MKVTVEVKDCRDCPFRKSHSGHGECWEYCSHPKAPPTYGSILWGCQEDFKRTPNWCPIQTDKKE